MAAVFSVSFLAGAITVFALAAIVGDLVGTGEWPARARELTAAAVLLTLAGTDLYAIRASSYSPLGIRRQTPKRLQRQFGPGFVSAIWGFDTGLAVTTIRVTAATWAVLLLVGLGLASWVAGAVYGLSYALPTLWMFWTHPTAKRESRGETASLGIQRLLSRRPLLQGISAITLTLAATLMLLPLAA